MSSILASVALSFFVSAASAQWDEGSAEFLAKNVRR